MISFSKTITGVAAATLLGAAFIIQAQAAEPIVGKWKRSNGTIIKYSGSGSTFCGRVMNKKYAGKSIGCVSGKGKKYKGKVKKLDEGKTYAGKATVTGNELYLQGCALFGTICKGETLIRQ